MVQQPFPRRPDSQRALIHRSASTPAPVSISNRWEDLGRYFLRPRTITTPISPFHRWSRIYYPVATRNVTVESTNPSVANRNRHTQARARGTGHTPAGNVGEQEEHDSFTSRPRCSHQNVTNSEPPTAYSRISYGAPLRHALTSPLPSHPASKDDYITDLSYSAGEKEGNHGHASASRITLHRPPSISRVTASNERDLYRPSLSNRFFPPEPGKTRVSTDRATYHRLAHIPTRAEPGQAINDIANKAGRISWRRV